MQKNLLTKTAVIIAILLVFLFGIFGIPKGVSGDALKQAILGQIHLGLDLTGGTHLILQVMVNDAVNAETDHAVEVLKDELQKAKVPFSDISKPDPANHPEQIAVKGVSLDGGSTLRSIVSDQLKDYDPPSAGANSTWVINMKPSSVSDLQRRTVEQSIEAIRNRVDALGVSEPEIQENGMGLNQILVQLPNVDDPGRVREIIKSTARLELRQGFDNQGGYDSEQAALAQHGGVLPPGTVMMHGIAGGNDQSDRVFVVGRIPVVGGTDIRDARPSTDQNGRPNVTFNLTAAAGNKFGAFTSAHNEKGSDPNHFLAVVLDNKVREFASIREEIRDTGEITGGFTEQSAKDLAMLLRSGALPASLHYLSENTVGPSLGADSIRSGVRAAIAGLAAVLIFMLVYYKGAGINADVALIFNLVILLGFMGFTGSVLTLPGIAGVILTVGMGVDSNVLIFERIREELRNNKAPAAAVDQGFDRAWTTILDTHVTTIVSAIILFFVGSGPVRGFAVTLTFGLLANLFTAVFVSRVIFDAVLNRKQRGEALSI
ncbi:MAG TPA: protein translocase subunit SecD [Candidatus Angelobacter sp.]|jgi:preprotein translocase subunit SecD|nr:protein translocase subunit SecD [Candidatus Angelobacter sp.]